MEQKTEETEERKRERERENRQKKINQQQTENLETRQTFIYIYISTETTSSLLTNHTFEKGILTHRQIYIIIHFFPSLTLHKLT